MDSVAAIIWIVSFVLVTVTVTGLSRRAGWSAPVALVIVGGAVSFIPAIPHVEVEPDLILFGLLPPLLFASAVRTPLSDIRARGDSIIVLSVGLVAVTVVAVGFALWWLVPAIGLAAALAFGAVVAPTDAVAVTAIAGRLNLPRRVVSVLETESLLNDAAALVALNASIAAIISIVNPFDVALDFGLALVIGVGLGAVVGFVISFVRGKMHSPVLDTSLSLTVPYIAFIPTQLLGGSGVLAVVVAGLIVGHRAPLVQSAEARIAATANWRTIRFLLENAVFLFIGLSLSGILEGVRESSFGFWQIVGISVAVLVTLFVSRIALVFLANIAFARGPIRQLRERAWNWRTTLAIGSAGIRGVVTLAAVFLLPEETPERELLQFLAFVVVAGTLLEGLALPMVIRALKLPAPNFSQEVVERHQLLAEVQAAGLTRLDAEVAETDDELVLRRLRLNATFLGEVLEQPVDENTEASTATYHRLRNVMLAAEREAVLLARTEGRYQDPAVRSVLATIDAEEAMLRSTGPGE